MQSSLSRWVLAMLAALLCGASVRAQDASASLEDMKALEAHLLKLKQKIIPATVALRIGGAEGSGVIVSSDGYVATAAHVFDRSNQRVRITMHDGRRLRGVTLGRQERADYGLIKIESEEPLPFVAMGDSSALRRRQLVVATGHPGGYVKGRQPPLRFGYIISTRGPFVCSDCAINEGDSGGPLFDLSGRVVGIHSRIRSRVSQNYHVPISRVRENWRRLKESQDWDDGEGEFPPGPVVGVYGRDARGGGCEIVKVYADMPAAKAGLRVDDVVRKIDDVEIKGVDDLVRNIRRRAPGDVIQIEFRRDGKTQTIDVKLGKSPNEGGRESSHLKKKNPQTEDAR